jgi:pSer/pThr/pTyr-binding forkhead associated (FHA) protein
MWKLTIEDDEGQQTSLSLAVDEYRLGRAEANTIRLTDRNVSRNHAILKKNGQGWLVKDLASYNGTYVNGVRVAGEQLVSNGDIVQLGDYRLELIDESTLAPTGPGAPPPVSQLPPVHLRPNRLVVIVGPQPGAEFPLNQEKMTIGRSEDATISINHSSVSRVHAELIALGNGRFEIIDKGSANGIRVNGVDLRRGILEAGDALELGDVRMRFVGAGKIFRAGGDPRVGGGVVMHTPPQHGVSVGKLVGIGAVVGVLLIIGFLFLMGVFSPPPPVGGDTTHTPATSEDTLRLEEANKLLDSGDVEGAHKKVLEIPESSGARDDDRFKRVEGGWADALFQQVDKATSAGEKTRILNIIATTPSVDAERRKKAADMISAIIAAEPTAKPVTPIYQGPGPTGGGDPSPTGGAPTPPPTTPTTVSTPPPAQGPPDEAAMRRALEPKVWGNRATLEEVRLLKAICSHMGDKTCRNRANAILQQMQEKQKGN